MASPFNETCPQTSSGIVELDEISREVITSSLEYANTMKI
jgi:hypothetical protein